MGPDLSFVKPLYTYGSLCLMSMENELITDQWLNSRLHSRFISVCKTAGLDINSSTTEHAKPPSNNGNAKSPIALPPTNRQAIAPTAARTSSKSSLSASYFSPLLLLLLAAFLVACWICWVHNVNAGFSDWQFNYLNLLSLAVSFPNI